MNLLFAAAAALLMMAFPALAADAPAWPMPDWQQVTPAEAGMDQALLEKARDYALSGGGSGMITRGGRLVLSWGSLTQRYDLKSSTKSIGVTALGLALKDGKVRLDDPVVKYHPEFGITPESNLATGWLPKITLWHLATQTAGFEKPGGYGKVMFEPGTRWFYSDAGPNWLAECLTLAYKRDMDELLFERVFAPIGITRDDLQWRKNSYRPAEIQGIMRREFGSGVSADVNAMARLGLLYLHEGQWQGQEVLPESFIRAASTSDPRVAAVPTDGPAHPGAAKHYGLLWWNNADGALPGVPRDAYWSWGLYDSFIMVVPSLDLVVSRAGKSWKRTDGAGQYAVLEPFLGSICRAVK